MKLKEMHRRVDANINITVSFFTKEHHLNKEDYLDEAIDEVMRGLMYNTSRGDIKDKISLKVHPWEEE